MKRVMIQLQDEQEAKRIKAEASNLGLSVSNYFRTKAGLPPMRKAGAPKGNKNAKKEKG
jgi:hypothetical protein